MWSTSDFAQDTVEIAERRTRPRTVLSPPIYVNLDNATGGLIFNMTEEGLALTAARTLGGEGPLGLRICLPDSEGWIEATGQMVWRSEAGKTVGIRDNGGMLLNSGEGGFAIATAECVTGDGFPSIRIQFTGSMDLIDVSGQVAWISESKREAGIRFVNLKEEARRIIAARISREESPVDRYVQSIRVAGSPPLHSEFPKPKNSTPRDAGSENGVQEHLWALGPSPLAMPSMRDNQAVPAVAAPDALPVKFRKRSKFKPQSRPAIGPRTREEAAERLRRIAATVVLVGVTGGAIGWVVMSHAIRNAVNGFNAENTQGTNV